MAAPVKVVVDEYDTRIELVFYSPDVILSSKYGSTEFCFDNYSDHPDRESVGMIARSLIDGLFSLGGVTKVKIEKGVLVISASRREFWWCQHKEDVSQVLRTALGIERINFVEGS